MEQKIQYRIHFVIDQGWEIEDDGFRFGVYYPTWSEAYNALERITCLLKSADGTAASSGIGQT